MLRATFGLGASKVDAELRDAGDELEYTSLGASFSVDVGAAPIENLVVHGRIGGFTLSQPDLQVNGEDRSAEGVGLHAFLIAPAVTYYVMPLNVYATAVIGLSWIVYVNAGGRDETDATDPGVGVNLELGKEWWIHSAWGFGVAGRFWFTRLNDDIADERVETSWSGFALLFSTTYQ